MVHENAFFVLLQAEELWRRTMTMNYDFELLSY